MSKAITITLTDEQYERFERLRKGFTPEKRRSELVVWMERIIEMGLELPEMKRGA